MEIIPIPVIGDETGFSVPNLPFLNSDCRTFETLLLQPSGIIQANESGIGNCESKDTVEKYISFLRYSKQSNADLVVTPEYSCPWQALLRIVEKNTELPNDGKLWVIGCESITKESPGSLPKHDHIRWIFDDSVLEDDKCFLDPVCYIFKTTDQANKSIYVGLIQFKTIEMADHIEYLERDNMIQGRHIYRIESIGSTNGLCTLICSDVFNVDEKIIEQLIDRPTHIVHVQLNLNPRDSQFSKYRRECLQFGSDNVEIFTINWARDTSALKPYDKMDFSESWGTAIYSKSTDVHLDNRRVAHNHNNGLFLCYWSNRVTWAYYFDHNEAVFRLRCTPVSQRLVPGPLAKRTGPEMLEILNWEYSKWSVSECAQVSKFKETLERYDLSDLFLTFSDEEDKLDVVKVERLLALSLGNACSARWYAIPYLRSFIIDDTENIKRITCSLDNSHEAIETRNTSLINYQILLNEILANPKENLPDNLSDLRDSVLVAYEENRPNCNMYDLDMRRPATGVFLGLYPDDSIPKQRYDEVSSCLEDSEKRRLVLWYNCTGSFESISVERRPEITDTYESSNTGINSTFKPGTGKS